MAPARLPTCVYGNTRIGASTPFLQHIPRRAVAPVRRRRGHVTAVGAAPRQSGISAMESRAVPSEREPSLPRRRARRCPDLRGKGARLWAMLALTATERFLVLNGYMLGLNSRTTAGDAQQLPPFRAAEGTMCLRRGSRHRRFAAALLTLTAPLLAAGRAVALAAGAAALPTLLAAALAAPHNRGRTAIRTARTTQLNPTLT